VTGDALVVADGHRGGVGDGHAVAGPLEAFKQGCQRGRATGRQLDDALVARQPGKLGPQVTAGVVEVEAFELAEAELVKKDHQRHQLGQAQFALAAALF